MLITEAKSTCREKCIFYMTWLSAPLTVLYFHSFCVDFATLMKVNKINHPRLDFRDVGGAVQ